MYNMCGDFGGCNSDADAKCKCLPGFGPFSPDSWDSGDFSDGRIRKSMLCSKSTVSETTLLNWKAMKVGKPDSEFVAADEMECKEECPNNCQCQAYSFEEVESATGHGGSSGELRHGLVGTEAAEFVESRWRSQGGGGDRRRSGTGACEEPW